MNLIKGLLFFSVLIILSRIIPHPPNFTPLIAGAIFLPFMSQDKRVILTLPLALVFISDLIIGFHNTMLWTYSSFLLIGLIVLRFSKFDLKNLLGLSILSPTLFFLVSNFGVWSSSEMYSKDLLGLTESYIMAIPFYANSLISTIFFSLVFYATRNIALETRPFNYFK